MAEAMEKEMELSDSEQINGNAHVSISQYSAPPVYNRTGLMAVYGNSAFGLEKGIQRIQNHQELPGYVFMCNGRTKMDCFRYRVFGIPRARIDVVESIKPGMKLFLYDFEKKLLYGVYEATMSGKFNIEPEAFEKKYPAQVGFRIVQNCYPLPEETFKSAIHENYNGPKFKQELAPHQVVSLLSLFRSFNSPELDLLPQRLASRAAAPKALSFEERLIAASQHRNASSVLDPLSARHADPRHGSLMAHQSVPRTPLLQYSHPRQDDYTTPVRESPRSSIQDPQLKYLTTLSNIRRYGTAPDRSASETEYYPAMLSEKEQYASPYSAAANGSVYRSEYNKSASQKEGEASQQHEIPAGTYYHPEASTVPYTTVSKQSDMQAIRVAQSLTETTGYPTPVHGEAPQQAAGAIGYAHQPQSVAGNYTTHSQPGSVKEESKQSYAGIVSDPQQEYYAAMGHAAQLYASATGYTQQPHEIVYAQQPHEIVYAQQPHAAATGYSQQQYDAATGYAQQYHAAETEYAQQYYAAATSHAQQPQAAATVYAQQPHTQAVGYTTQYDPQTGAYTQQAVTQSSIPGAPGTNDLNAASQSYYDWHLANQAYYPHTADATTTYNQTS